jgi:hypothetical protein
MWCGKFANTILGWRGMGLLFQTRLAQGMYAITELGRELPTHPWGETEQQNYNPAIEHRDGKDTQLARIGAGQERTDR